MLVVYTNDNELSLFFAPVRHSLLGLLLVLEEEKRKPGSLGSLRLLFRILPAHFIQSTNIYQSEEETNIKILVRVYIGNFIKVCNFLATSHLIGEKMLQLPQKFGHTNREACLLS